MTPGELVNIKGTMAVEKGGRNKAKQSNNSDPKRSVF